MSSPAAPVTPAPKRRMPTSSLADETVDSSAQATPAPKRRVAASATADESVDSSAQATPASKRGKTTSEDSASLIPLILAVNPNISLDFKAMSALSGTLTPSALEHRFRKFKAEAKALREAKGGSIEGLEPVQTKNPRARKEKGGETRVAQPKTKKRKNADDKEGSNEDEAPEKPEKKAKVVKKGIARVIKKGKKEEKVDETSEEAGEEFHHETFPETRSNGILPDGYVHAQDLPDDWNNEIAGGLRLMNEE
ncbi:hypothetical protein MMC20_001537 [Loxospora ochrophaea]|nr:hypothetical protein [Loxospora ochrophaea]